MRKVFATCGTVGSGKTTFAKQLANEYGAIRFSMDEWMIPLFGEHMPRAEFDQRLDQLTELFQQAAVQLLDLEIAVIFDFGLWSKQQRSELRDWASGVNAELEIIYMRCDFTTCRTRVLGRNSSSKNVHYQINEEMLQLFLSRFEEPGEDESVTVINADAG